MKVPSLRGNVTRDFAGRLAGIAHGILANQSEQIWSTYEPWQDQVAPVLHSWFGGLIQVYPRCEELPAGYAGPLPEFDPPLGDDKTYNYGLLGGQVVRIDYDGQRSPCGRPCCRTRRRPVRRRAGFRGWRGVSSPPMTEESHTSGGPPLTADLIAELAAEAERGQPVPGEEDEDPGTPAADGMPVSVRLRHDFVITNATLLMDTARDLFRRRCPEVPAAEVPAHVSTAEDAVYELVEAIGISGLHGTKKTHPKWTAAGLAPQGFAGLVRPNDPGPMLPREQSCFDLGDPFAVPDWDDM